MIRWPVVALAVLALGATARGPQAFRFEPDATAELRRLWTGSRDAKTERVACLAGETRRDTVMIIRILPLTGWADSLGVSAAPSLETCAPPRWQGTVHTHVALYDGARPYSRFSGADRGVNGLWWRRWHAEGLFCVLYSATGAYCEIDGPRGVAIFPRSAY
ncbi:MAG: hypothetical protein H0T50_11730 [Gemmatimonadales bacterium]|nr:hypothetical protein [Gemmatimonadales bacterium]